MARNVRQVTFDDTAVEVEYDDGTTRTYFDSETPPVTPPPPPPLPPVGGVIRGGYFDDIPNDRAAAYASLYNMTWVRLWHMIDWSNPPGPVHPTFIRARALQAAGLKTLVCFTPAERTGIPASSPLSAESYFTNAAVNANGCVNAWEMWNEPNLAQYNASYAQSSSLWIRNGLAPAYRVLHYYNQFVVGGSWYGTAKGYGFEYAIQNGYLQNCDAVGYHPYGSDTAQQVRRVEDMRSLIGDKPLWLTEWNLQPSTSYSLAAWADMLEPTARAVGPMVQALFYFKMVRNAQNPWPASPYTLVNGVLNRSEIFADDVMAAMHAF